MEQFSATTLTDNWGPTLMALFPGAARAVGALMMLLLMVMLAERVRRGTVKSIGHTRADPNIAVFVGRLAHLGTVVLGILIALGILGISWTALLAVVGAISLALSLALQDVLKNFVSGLYLLIERPFRVGDTIKVKDFVGQVEDIGIRTTVLHTSDARQVIVPNAVIFTEVVVNLSGLAPAVPSGEGESLLKAAPQTELRTEG